jgi:hypothetical protein
MKELFAKFMKHFEVHKFDNQQQMKPWRRPGATDCWHGLCDRSFEETS